MSQLRRGENHLTYLCSIFLSFYLVRSTTNPLTREYRQLQSQSGAQSGTQFRAQSQQFQPPSQSSQSQFRAIRGSSIAESDWHTSPSAPSSVPSTAAWYSEGEVPLERDDWWYKGTGNLLLNRSGEHRMYINQINDASNLSLKNQRLCGPSRDRPSGRAPQSWLD